MSISEYYGKVLGVSHTDPKGCQVCAVTYTTPARTSTKTWSKR